MKLTTNIKYFWETENWISNPDLPESYIKRALSLEKLEKELMTKLDYKNMSIMLGKAIENELANSSAIEAISLDSRRLRSSIAKSMGLMQDEWDVSRQETGKEERAVKALLFLMETDKILSHDSILQTHAMYEVCQGTGHYRNHSEVVLDEDGNIVYEAPPGNLVQTLMDTFISWYNSARHAVPRFIGSSLCHYFFVAIHPFRDGNGRLARMLADKSLADDGTFRPFSMSAAIQHNKSLYYDYLDAAHTNNGILQYLDFMLNIQESALANASYKADKLFVLHDWLTRSRHKFNSAEKAILHEMTLGDRQYWTFFDATKHMWDGEVSENAWKNLSEMGIIRNGNLVLKEL